MNLLTNFVNIIQNLIPEFLRKSNFINWLNSLIKPLSTLHYDASNVVTNFGQTNLTFYQWYEFIRNYLRFNGQIIYLEKYLNQTYLPLVEEPWITNTGIYIVNTASVNFSYVYNTIEGKPPIYLSNTSENDPVYMYNTADIANAYDFIVYVPTSLVFDMTLMQSRINQYKLAGKSYQILTY